MSASNGKQAIVASHRVGEGSPLVLLHGLTGAWRVWRPVIASLSAEHDVFVPTLAGHSGALPVDGPVSITSLADAMERTLDEASIETAHLAGNSLGGWLALELARRGRAKSVVALSPAGAWVGDHDLRRVTAMFLRSATAFPVVLPHIAWAIRRPRSRRLLMAMAMEHADRMPAAEAAELFEDYSGCTIVRELVGSLDTDGGFGGDMSDVDVPIRIAWGERDRTIPFARYGEPYRSLVPNAEFVTLAAVGHVPMYDDPALVVRTILEVTSAADSDAATPVNTPAPQTTGAKTPMSTMSTDRGNIFVHEWSSDEPSYIALLAHGYGEHAGRYEHVAARLVADGAAVYAPDHFGHGRSDGERALVEDLEAIVSDLHAIADRARAEHPGLPVVLIGHSMGGLIATRFAQQHGDELSALVLSGPVIGGNPDIEALMAMDPMPEVPIDPATLSRDPAVGEAYMADELVYHGPFQRPTLETLFAAAKTVADGPKLRVPTLWLHGETDALAPVAATRPVAEAIAGDVFESKIYEGAAHEIFNETNQEEVIDDAIAFLTRQLAATTPAAD